MLKEFKTFILRGNVLDLAVGIIIGGAFQGIVKSLVDDLFMPLISLVTGSLQSLGDLFVALDGQRYASLATAKAAGVSTLNYGAFLSTIINFLLIALCLFLVVKAVNRLRAIGEKPAAPAAPTTKACPFCQSDIPIKATRCPHCTSELPVEAADEPLAEPV